MKGSIKVKRLNKSGLFISDIDWDNCYKEKGNPKGNFVMIIEPLEGWDNGIIYFQKTDGGYWIEGESYILTGRKDILDSRVAKWKREYKRKDFDFVEKDLSDWHIER